MSDRRTQLIQSLHGSQFHVPDLRTIFHHWPHAINPHIDAVRKDIDERLESLVSGRRLQKMKKINLPLFCASWWPNATYEQLRTTGYLGVWFFAWDDETDSGEYNNYVNNTAAAEAYNAETLDFVKASLYPKLDLLKDQKTQNYIIRNFQAVGEAIAAGYPEDKVDQFYAQMKYFIDMTEVEQRHHVAGEIPTLEQYWERRMGSVAVGPCLALSEFCNSMLIPQKIMDSPEMQTLWDATNIIVAVTNDILSVRKEFADGQVDTLIPVLYLETGDIEEAVEQAVDILLQNVEKFEETARLILKTHGKDLQLRLDLTKFIDSCMFAVTGSLDWGISSGRYGEVPLNKGVEVKLEHKSLLA